MSLLQKSNMQAEFDRKKQWRTYYQWYRQTQFRKSDHLSNHNECEQHFFGLESDSHESRQFEVLNLSQVWKHLADKNGLPFGDAVSCSESKETNLEGIQSTSGSRVRQSSRYMIISMNLNVLTYPHIRLPSSSWTCLRTNMLTYRTCWYVPSHTIIMITIITSRTD